MRRIRRASVTLARYGPRAVATIARMATDPRRPTGPLAGVRVVDASTVLAGPYATMLLADLGADVVKVEPPEGDATRGWGPPWVGRAEDGTRTAAYYLAVNRNKRSLRLDLKQPAGADVLRRLLADADVFVENLRPDSLARLGFDDAALAAINPRLDPPRDQRLRPDRAARRPPRLRLPPPGRGRADVDHRRGRRRRRRPDEGRRRDRRRRDRAPRRGRDPRRARRPRASASSPAHGTGQRVDVSIFESTLSVLVNQAQNAFVDGVAPGRLGNAHPSIVPYETFETADGEIAVAVGSERQWPRFCRALGLPALADDPRFATNGDRVENRVELIATLRRALRRAGVRASGSRRSTRPTSRPARSTTSPTAFASPRAVARQMAVEVEPPGARPDDAGGSAVRAVGDAGLDPDRAAAARRALGRDPRRARLRRAPRSRRSAPRGVI